MAYKRLLIIEDDHWLADAFTTILAGHYTLQAVDSAEAAIQAIDDFHPDILLLDVMLAGPSAFALLHEIQSYQDTRRLPIVLCTSLSSMQSQQEVLEKYGVVAVLDKVTMTPRGLRRTLQEICL